MLMFKNVKIIHTEVEDGKYNDNKKKFIKYKRPKKIVKTVFDDDFVGDIGELYEVIKFHEEKNHSGTLEVKLKPEVQY
jgi:hypothetical protein|tara:strand:+ start:388 stop:621 length:234 start_codon:yes stop_codon:yes gene_type:complete